MEIVLMYVSCVSDDDDDGGACNVAIVASLAFDFNLFNVCK